MMRTDAYQQFKERLFSGELKPGQFVSQRELASLLGVTMNPVREAVRQLECEQLIKVYPKKGIQVVEGDPKSINDAYDYRILLEQTAIRKFAADATVEYIAEIRSHIDTVAVSLERSPDDIVVRLRTLEEDFRFHKKIIDFLGNQIMSDHYSFNAARVRLFRRNIGQPLKRLGTAIQEHVAILEACTDRNTEQAVRLLTDHIEISRAHTLGIRPM